MVAAGVRPDHAGTERWLTLGQACRMLGVDESTLRRWADAGQVRTFRTPGGHRRFAESDLQSWLAGRHGARPGAELSDVATSRIRRQMHGRAVHEARWYAGLDEATRARMRGFGRQLMNLVGEYFTRRHRRSSLLGLARSLGRQYGETLAAAGLGLSQAVEAFTFFRRSLEESARKAVHSHGASAAEALDASEQIMALADQVLVGMSEAYDASLAETPQT